MRLLASFLIACCAVVAQSFIVLPISNTSPTIYSGAFFQNSDLIIISPGDAISIDWFTFYQPVNYDHCFTVFFGSSPDTITNCSNPFPHNSTKWTQLTTLPFCSRVYGSNGSANSVLVADTPIITDAASVAILFVVSLGPTSNQIGTDTTIFSACDYPINPSFAGGFYGTHNTSPQQAPFPSSFTVYSATTTTPDDSGSGSGSGDLTDPPPAPYLALPFLEAVPYLFSGAFFHNTGMYTIPAGVPITIEWFNNYTTPSIMGVCIDLYFGSTYTPITNCSADPLPTDVEWSKLNHQPVCINLNGEPSVIVPDELVMSEAQTLAFAIVVPRQQTPAKSFHYHTLYSSCQYPLSPTFAGAFYGSRFCNPVQFPVPTAFTPTPAPIQQPLFTHVDYNVSSLFFQHVQISDPQTPFFAYILSSLDNQSVTTATVNLYSPDESLIATSATYILTNLEPGIYKIQVILDVGSPNINLYLSAIPTATILTTPYPTTTTSTHTTTTDASILTTPTTTLAYLTTPAQAPYTTTTVSVTDTTPISTHSVTDTSTYHLNTSTDFVFGLTNESSLYTIATVSSPAVHVFFYASITPSASDINTDYMGIFHHYPTKVEYLGLFNAPYRMRVVYGICDIPTAPQAHPFSISFTSPPSTVAVATTFPTDTPCILPPSYAYNTSILTNRTDLYIVIHAPTNLSAFIYNLQDGTDAHMFLYDDRNTILSAPPGEPMTAAKRIKNLPLSPGVYRLRIAIQNMCDTYDARNSTTDRFYVTLTEPFFVHSPTPSLFVPVECFSQPHTPPVDIYDTNVPPENFSHITIAYTPQDLFFNITQPSLLVLHRSITTILFFFLIDDTPLDYNPDLPILFAEPIHIRIRATPASCDIPAYGPILVASSITPILVAPAADHYSYQCPPTPPPPAPTGVIHATHVVVFNITQPVRITITTNCSLFSQLPATGSYSNQFELEQSFWPSRNVHQFIATDPGPLAIRLTTTACDIPEPPPASCFFITNPTPLSVTSSVTDYSHTCIPSYATLPWSYTVTHQSDFFFTVSFPVRAIAAVQNTDPAPSAYLWLYTESNTLISQPAIPNPYYTGGLVVDLVLAPGTYRLRLSSGHACDTPMPNISHAFILKSNIIPDSISTTPTLFVPSQWACFDTPVSTTTTTTTTTTPCASPYTITVAQNQRTPSSPFYGVDGFFQYILSSTCPILGYTFPDPALVNTPLQQPIIFLNASDRVRFIMPSIDYDTFPISPCTHLLACVPPDLLTDYTIRVDGSHTVVEFTPIMPMTYNSEFDHYMGNYIVDQSITTTTSTAAQTTTMVTTPATSTSTAAPTATHVSTFTSTNQTTEPASTTPVTTYANTSVAPVTTMQPTLTTTTTHVSTAVTCASPYTIHVTYDVKTPSSPFYGVGSPFVYILHAQCPILGYTFPDPSIVDTPLQQPIIYLRASDRVRLVMSTADYTWFPLVPCTHLRDCPFQSRSFTNYTIGLDGTYTTIEFAPTMPMTYTCEVELNMGNYILELAATSTTPIHSTTTTSTTATTLTQSTTTTTSTILLSTSTTTTTTSTTTTLTQSTTTRTTTTRTTTTTTTTTLTQSTTTTTRTTTTRTTTRTTTTTTTTLAPHPFTINEINHTHVEFIAPYGINASIIPNTLLSASNRTCCTIFVYMLSPHGQSTFTSVGYHPLSAPSPTRPLYNTRAFDQPTTYTSSGIPSFGTPNGPQILCATDPILSTDSCTTTATIVPAYATIDPSVIVFDAQCAVNYNQSYTPPRAPSPSYPLGIKSITNTSTLVPAYQPVEPDATFTSPPVALLATNNTVAVSLTISYTPPDLLNTNTTQSALVSHDTFYITPTYPNCTIINQVLNRVEVIVLCTNVSTLRGVASLYTVNAINTPSLATHRDVAQTTTVVQDILPRPNASCANCSGLACLGTCLTQPDPFYIRMYSAPMSVARRSIRHTRAVPPGTYTPTPPANMRPCTTMENSLLGHLTLAAAIEPVSMDTCAQSDLAVLQAAFRSYNNAGYSPMTYISSMFFDPLTDFNPITTDYADFDNNGYIDSHDVLYFAAALTGAAPVFYERIYVPPVSIPDTIVFTHAPTHIYKVSLFIWFVQHANTSIPLDTSLITAHGSLLDSNIPTPTRLLHLVSCPCSQTTYDLSSNPLFPTPFVRTECDYSAVFTDRTAVDVIATSYITQEHTPIVFTPNPATETTWVLPNIWQYPAPSFPLVHQHMIDPSQTPTIWLPSYPIPYTTTAGNTLLTYAQPPVTVNHLNPRGITFSNTEQLSPAILCHHYVPIIVYPSGPFIGQTVTLGSPRCPHLVQNNNICIQPHAPLYVIEGDGFPFNTLPLAFPSITTFDRRRQPHASLIVNTQTGKQTIHIRAQNTSILTSLHYTDLQNTHIGAFVVCSQPTHTLPKDSTHDDVVMYTSLAVIATILSLIFLMACVFYCAITAHIRPLMSGYSKA